MSASTTGRMPASAIAVAVGLGIDLVGIFAFRRRGGAEGRHFDDLVAEMHMREAEAPADQAAIAKQTPHLFRQGIGRHVEILRALCPAADRAPRHPPETPGSPPL